MNIYSKVMQSFELYGNDKNALDVQSKMQNNFIYGMSKNLGFLSTAGDDHSISIICIAHC